MVYQSFTPQDKLDPSGYLPLTLENRNLQGCIREDKGEMILRQPGQVLTSGWKHGVPRGEGRVARGQQALQDRKSVSKYKWEPESRRDTVTHLGGCALASAQNKGRTGHSPAALR